MMKSKKMWAYCSHALFSTQLVFGVLSLGLGLVSAPWLTPVTLLIGLLVYEGFIIAIWRATWRVRLLGAMYYILGYIIGRALFRQTRHDVFGQCTEPWRQTRHFCETVERDRDLCLTQLNQPFVDPDITRTLQGRVALLDRLRC